MSYFGLAIYHPKKHKNIGTLLRHNFVCGGSSVSIIGRRFKPQAGDVPKSYRHIPVTEYSDFDDFYKHLPYDCQLVGVELHPDATDLKEFRHPKRCIYLLGAEDHGLPDAVLKRCHKLVRLGGEHSMNVSTAGTVVIYHRQFLYEAKNG